MRRHPLVGSTLLIVAVVTALSPARPPATAAPAAQADSLTAADLWAAIAPASVIGDLPGADLWLPGLPIFDRPTYAGNTAPLPGEVVYAEQRIVAENGPIESVELDLWLFADADAAAAAVERAFTQYWPGAARQNGPTVGERQRHFRTRLGPGLLFARGPLLAAVVIEEGEDAREDLVGEVARGLDRRMQALLAGRLRAAPLPPTLAGLLPPAERTATLGPEIGTARWPLADLPSLEMENDLLAAGAQDMIIRWYGVEAERAAGVRVTLIRFADAGGATVWLEGHRPPASFLARGRLPLGSVSEPASFTDGLGLSAHLFAFARGRTFVEVRCGRGPDDNLPACEAIARTMAETWSGWLSATGDE